MKNIIKYASLSLFAAALAITPLLTRAQDASTNAPAMSSDSSTNAPTATHKKKKGAGLPFHGKIAAIDASAGTFSVGELSLTVTSTTKITTNGAPATLADFKVDDSVSGYYKKATDGTLNVSTLRLGGGKKKAAATPAQ